MALNYFENLLQTKTYSPPLRDDYVSRPRIINQLNRVEPFQDILITAPAGYGKTMLAVEWLNQLETDHAWFAIDRQDNDLGQFLTYVIFSLRQSKPGFCTQVLELIHSPEPPAASRLINYLINDLTCLQERVILVLDDYHLIDNQEVHDAVSHLIHHRPAQLQMVLLSREEFPFATASLRASNKIFELGLYDLRFTVKEADAFLKQTFGIELPFEKVVRLDNRVEGWVTGLQLAALSMRNSDDEENFFQQFSGKDRLIRDYLFEQVISAQPQSISQFLHRTSILDWISAPFCDQILGIENSREIIRQLDEGNLFLIPLDNTGERYRYHHLFAEVLENRLKEQDLELISELYRRASTWHQQQGNINDAVEYAIRADAFNQAAELILSIVNQVIREGGRRRILRWLTSFPDQILRDHLMLWVHLITASLGLGKFEQARRSIERLWGDDRYFEGLTRGEIDAVLGFRAGFLASIEIHTTLDARKTRNLAQQAREIFPEDMEFGRSIGPGYYAVGCFYAGDMKAARDSVQLAVELSQRHKYSRLHLLWSCYQALIEIESGQLLLAEDYLQNALTLAEQIGVLESNVVSSVFIGQGVIFLERGQWELAGEYFERGISTAETAKFIDYLSWGYRYYFRYLTSSGQVEKAKVRLAVGREIGEEYHLPPLVQDHLETMTAFLDFQAGDLDKSRAWAAKNADWKALGNTGLDIFKRLTLARVWLADQRVSRSIPLLQVLVVDTAENQLGNAYLEGSMLLAKAHVWDGSPQEGLEVLAEALEFAQPQGYQRTILEGGDEVRGLIQELILTGNQTNSGGSDLEEVYLQQLLDGFEQEKIRIKDLGLDQRDALQADILTSREREILSLLAEGLSYAELADSLTITQNTVKTHIKNIYRKLEVNNKTEAINQARSLHIM
ncbi:MAG: LuxR C-terminal-related transcriptional regulator [Anaerolineales bacterium]|nr:LuxR C-terminal-related transcriptional regulator [Anaerolineales bacterium]